MTVDILYVAHNRLEYTRQSFAALLANTDWGAVNRLYVADDGSTDGTAEYLGEQTTRINEGRMVLNATYLDRPFGGPVAAMNWYLSETDDTVDVFAKIDNDRIVPPGWLHDMQETLAQHAELDALGMEPHEESRPVECYAARSVTYSSHIGGVGLIRRRIFNTCRPVANGVWGWSEFQGNHEKILTGWVTPDIPLFGLDQLPMEPWVSLRAEYIAKGWMRPWDHPDVSAHSAWWNPV